MAAMSDSAPARARQPMSAGVECSRRKWVPSTMVSPETTLTPSARTTAASSPIQRSTRGERDSNVAAMASIRSRSRTASGPGGRAGLPVPVDDAGAVEVVGRELAADPVAGQDPDPVAPHLSRHVTEHDVVVVELDPEHGVRERLDHLALELQFLFFGHQNSVAPKGVRPLSGVAGLLLGLAGAAALAAAALVPAAALVAAAGW